MANDSKKCIAESARAMSSKKKSPFLQAKVMGSDAEMSQSAMGITLQSSSSKMTSTPAITTSNFPTFDASAIAADASYMPAIKQPLVSGARRKLPFKAANRVKTHNNSILPRIAMPGKQRIKLPKDPDHLTEEELDVLYCQYVQSLYLLSRSKKSLDLRSKDAAEKLHKLWTVNQILMKEDKTLQMQLDSVMYMKQLIAVCENQKTMLLLVNDLIPKVMDQYEEIADAVETIRHKLLSPTVALPSDPDKEMELMESAKQYGALIESFLDALPLEHAKLDEVDELLQKLVQLKENVEQEVRKCSSLLSAVDHLTTMESSLRISEIQNKNSI